MKCNLCDNYDKIMKEVPIDGSMQPCNRGYYESEYCYAVLKPEQHTIGDSIVITKKHWEDISDIIPPEVLSDFIETINIVAIRLKNIVRNNRSEMPEKIYVGILCDGTPHLHAHLIPRYPFTEEDADKYAEYFTKRDGEIEILRKIKIDDLGGYWYIFNKEQSHYKSYYGQMDTKKKVAFLEELATKLRLPKKSKESSN